ncbi:MULTISPECIES: vWA domain-containing protein [Rhodomicrobium]|uniref:vWA domain-containing protein n=1 Tax=Rhodomicrobium TaxID=1068 RepID=UPI000B4AEC71|nr:MULTISPECIES: vWA domain-containing protein [Rhodomicrobium]
MTLAFDTPALLWLLPLAALPILASLLATSAYPSLAATPDDAFSTVTGWTLRLAGILAIAALIVGLAGPHSREQSVLRTGRGAHIALLIDRSSSMDNTFAGKQPSGADESKASAARRILASFVKKRPHDEIGVALFSTSPILALPLTLQRDAIEAAVNAIGRPGLAYTNIGLGLAMALSLFEDRDDDAPRTVLVVSDGAALIDRRVQQSLRTSFRQYRLHLYWLFLRTTGSPGIFPRPGEAGENSPQAMPERHLHKFFSELGIPYRVFEAENADAVEEAIAEIGRLEASPIRYEERVPRRDFRPAAFGAAAGAVLLLLLAKLSETRLAGRRP